jgi:hypothetical protein
MDKFDKLLYILSKSNLDRDRKINVLKVVIEDITSYGIGSEENIDGYLKIVIESLELVSEYPCGKRGCQVKEDHVH